MRLFLKAALHSPKHFIFLVLSFFTLIGLTLSNQMEMFAFGVLFDSDIYSCELSDEKKEKDRGEIDVKKKLKESEIARAFDRAVEKLKSRMHLRNGLKNFILMFCFIAAIKAFFLFFSRYTAQILSINISRDLRQRYFEHIQTLPMSFYQKYGIGSVSSRLSGDANQIASALNSVLANYVQAPFTLLTTMSFCFYMSWQLSLVMFVCLPMAIIPLNLLTRKIRRILHRLQQNQEQFNSVLIDFLMGIQTIKIFAMEHFSFKKYKEKNNQMSGLEVKTVKYDLLMRPIFHAVMTLCLATVVIIGFYTLKMKIPELVFFVGLLYLFYGPIRRFAEENANVQKGFVAVKRLFEVLSIKPQLKDLPHAVRFESLEKKIEFDRVWFRHHERWILRDLSFSVKRGETVALIGATGVGKSTIVQLIPRLYDVQRGEIRFDGKPIQSYTQRSLKEQIAFVPQKTVLFLDTIANNIAYGRPMLREEVVQAAKKAHAHEFIERMPQKYETMLLEMGKNFSGGQQQRLAIARALAKKAPILILDEATSSLDSLSEAKIKRAIRELHGGITQILVAHRLSTVEHADRIIYLEEGRKLAEGTKEELLERCPPFRLLWETHFSKEKEASPVSS